MKKRKCTLEDKLAFMVQELYAKYDRVVTPLYPRIFIRVLPKELTYGQIILPDAQQNKIQAEGVVLSVYKPFWRRISETRQGLSVIVTRKDEWIESAVKIGDHIVFPHYEGLPDPVFDEKKYRIIKEDTIGAVLTYEYQRPEEYLRSLLFTSQDADVKDILLKYDLVSKNVQCKTRSGV